MKGKVGLL